MTILSRIIILLSSLLGIAVTGLGFILADASKKNLNGYWPVVICSLLYLLHQVPVYKQLTTDVKKATRLAGIFIIFNIGLIVFLCFAIFFVSVAINSD